LTYVFQRSSQNPSAANQLFYAWEISMEFEVQLKSLRDQFQYIRPGVTISMDPPDTVLPTPVTVIGVSEVYNQLN
jgi:hypothetical protein